MKETSTPIREAPAVQEELPVRVQEALGELAAAAREGLLALSVGVGLGVLAELMEEEVVEVVGAKSKHDRERVAVRHGHEAGEVTLGGRRVGVERPRVRSADGASELPLVTYRHFADRDPLTRGRPNESHARPLSGHRPGARDAVQQAGTVFARMGRDRW
jgi:hypothetical protein